MSQAVATALVGGALLVVSGALLWHLTRGTTLWFDEWQWALNRPGGDLGTYLRPHNEHLSLVPIAIYKALFVTAGLEHYGPYRALVIAGHLACVSLVFVHAGDGSATWPRSWPHRCCCSSDGLGVRRFATELRPLASIPAAAPSLLRLRPDLAPQPGTRASPPRGAQASADFASG